MRKILILLIVALSACDKTEYELLPPQLEIEVSDTYSRNVSGVSISIFLDQDDWEQGVNKVTSGFTNNAGIVIFENLDEVVYFFEAVKGSQNNDKDVVSFENPLIKGEKRIVKTIIQ